MSNPQGTPQRASSAAARGSHDDEQWIEGLASLLMRLLGVCFTASAIISVFFEADRLILAWRLFTPMRHEALLWQGAMSASVVAVQFVIGIYLILGGQWVFDRILTPIACRRVDGSVPCMNEDASGNCQRLADAQDAGPE